MGTFSNKRDIIILALLLVIAAGIYCWPRSQGSASSTSTTKDKIVERVVTRVVARDGTVTESTADRAILQTREVAAAPAVPPAYRFTFSVNPMDAQKGWRTAVGMRLGRLPFWLEIGARPLLREVDLGISYEF